MSTIAINETAQAYNRIQSGYADADDSGKLEILLVLKQLLIQSHSRTPIFDFGYSVVTGGHAYVYASEQLDRVNRHIETLQSKGA